MTRYGALLARLEAGERILTDGGTGSEVDRRGVPNQQHAWSSGGALDGPEVLRQIHLDYLGHGAEVIISNTFSTSLNLLEDAGVPEQFEPANRRSVQLAVEARQIAGLPKVLVAAGLSHWSFSGRDPSVADLRDAARRQCAIMAKAGADLFMLEMMVDIDRMNALIDAAEETGLPIWAGLSCEPDETGAMRMQRNGPPLEEMIEAVAARDIPLLSIMHTDVAYIDDCLDVVERHWKGLTGVYAHSGRYCDGAWTFENTISEADFARRNMAWMDRDVRLIGGCCGIRPEHIAALGTAMQKMPA